MRVELCVLFELVEFIMIGVIVFLKKFVFAFRLLCLHSFNEAKFIFDINL